MKKGRFYCLKKLLIASKWLCTDWKQDEFDKIATIIITRSYKFAHWSVEAGEIREIQFKLLSILHNMVFFLNGAQSSMLAEQNVGKREDVFVLGVWLCRSSGS
jgi:hypothetical protein